VRLCRSKRKRVGDKCVSVLLTASMSPGLYMTFHDNTFFRSLSGHYCRLLKISPQHLYSTNKSRVVGMWSRCPLPVHQWIPCCCRWYSGHSRPETNGRVTSTTWPEINFITRLATQITEGILVQCVCHSFFIVDYFQQIHLAITGCY